MVDGPSDHVAKGFSAPPFLRLSQEQNCPCAPPLAPLPRVDDLRSYPAVAPPPPRNSRQDPFSVLGADLCLAHVLPLLDPASLACCAAVSCRWRTAASSSSLWRPLLGPLLASRAHIPLAILRSLSPLPPCTAFSITMLEAAQAELSPSQMCARIWEMRVKPTCGPYWYSLDPTSHGEDPLLRRFHCDRSITAMQENDPIWGGQESVWRFLKLERSDFHLVRQLVQINNWPHHHVLRLPDGRWRLDNEYASYTTCPDQDCNRPSFLNGKVLGVCSRCNPKPAEKQAEEVL